MRSRNPGGRAWLGLALVGAIMTVTASARAEDLTHRIVVELYRYREPDIRRCWTSSSPAGPIELLKIQLRVKSDGSVSVKKVEDPSEKLRACLDAAAGGWKLKAHPTKGAINLQPVSFSVIAHDLQLPTVHDLENIPPDLESSDWWAVCRRDGGFELSTGGIQVRRIRRDDPNPDERTHRLSILGCPKPVFALRNLPGASPRKLTVATNPAAAPDKPVWTMEAQPPVFISNEARELSLNGQRYWLQIPSDPKDIKVSLRSAASSQIILTIKTGEFAPDEYFEATSGGLHILWAGDLDADGKLDLVLWQDFAHDSVFRLYLSTAAPPGDLVGEAGLLFE